MDWIDTDRDTSKTLSMVQNFIDNGIELNVRKSLGSRKHDLGTLTSGRFIMGQEQNV